MSENILRIIATKQNPKKRSLNFVLFCETNNIQWTTEVSLESLHKTFNSMSNSLYLLNDFTWVKIESYNISYLSRITEEINAYFYHLRYRLDILCHPLIQDLLSVPYLQYPIDLKSQQKVSRSYSISSLSIIPETQNIIMTCTYSPILTKIGKLKSLLKPRHSGQITIYGFDESLYLIESIKTKEQVKSCYWKTNTSEAIFGLENGNFLLFSFKKKLGPNSKGIYDSEKIRIKAKSTFKVHESPVIAITGAEDLLISISLDSVFKISICSRRLNETESIETIGGGSLKDHLSQAALIDPKTGQDSNLVSIFFDHVTKKLFLGTDQGKVSVFLLENSIPKYQYSVSCGESVWDIEVSFGFMYLGVGKSIAVYTDTKEYEVISSVCPDKEGCKITCVKYLQSKEYLFAAFSNGMLIICHAVIFQVLLAVKVFDEPIICLKIDDLDEVLIVCSQSEIKLFKI